MGRTVYGVEEMGSTANLARKPPHGRLLCQIVSECHPPSASRTTRTTCGIIAQPVVIGTPPATRPAFADLLGRSEHLRGACRCHGPNGRSGKSGLCVRGAARPAAPVTIKETISTTKKRYEDVRKTEKAMACRGCGELARPDERVCRDYDSRQSTRPPVRGRLGRRLPRLREFGASPDRRLTATLLFTTGPSGTAEETGDVLRSVRLGSVSSRWWHKRLRLRFTGLRCPWMRFVGIRCRRHHDPGFAGDPKSDHAADTNHGADTNESTGSQTGANQRTDGRTGTRTAGATTGADERRTTTPASGSTTRRFGRGGQASCPGPASACCCHARAHARSAPRRRHRRSASTDSPPRPDRSSPANGSQADDDTTNRIAGHISRPTAIRPN